jgi:hypothetical protein
MKLVGCMFTGKFWHSYFVDAQGFLLMGKASHPLPKMPTVIGKYSNEDEATRRAYERLFNKHAHTSLAVVIKHCQTASHLREFTIVQESPAFPAGPRAPRVLLKASGFTNEQP